MNIHELSLVERLDFDHNCVCVIFDFLVVFCRKSRRKDKETPSPVSAVVASSHDDTRPYLDDDFTQERILDIDLAPLVSLPAGVEINEWLATHSTFLSVYTTCI